MHVSKGFSPKGGSIILRVLASKPGNASSPTPMLLRPSGRPPIPLDLSNEAQREASDHGDAGEQGAPE